MTATLRLSHALTPCSRSARSCRTSQGSLYRARTRRDLTGRNRRRLLHPLAAAYVRRLLICSSAIFGISAAPIAAAQSVRGSAASAFPVFDIGVAAAHTASRCIEPFDFATIRDTTSRDTTSRDSASGVTLPESVVIADSLDAADDTMDAAVTLPGSGMVLVDAHGRIIAPLSARSATAATTTTALAAAPATAVGMLATCCSANAEWSGVLLDLHAAGGQTASRGSSVRARCADAMNPPPSSRTPL